MQVFFGIPSAIPSQVFTGRRDAMVIVHGLAAHGNMPGTFLCHLKIYACFLLFGIV